jgi:phage-related holin
MKSLIATVAMLFLKTLLLPSVNLLLWMSIAIVVDFATGVAKAIVHKKPRTSTGYRGSLTKIIQYIGAITAIIILNSVIAITATVNTIDHTVIAKYLNDGIVIFIIYIEVTSIFENLYACDQTSKFSKFVITPLLKLLTLQLKGTPLTPIP